MTNDSELYATIYVLLFGFLMLVMYGICEFSQKRKAHKRAKEKTMRTPIVSERQKEGQDGRRKQVG